MSVDVTLYDGFVYWRNCREDGSGGIETNHRCGMVGIDEFGGEIGGVLRLQRA